MSESNRGSGRRQYPQSSEGAGRLRDDRGRRGSNDKDMAEGDGQSGRHCLLHREHNLLRASRGRRSAATRHAGNYRAVVHSDQPVSDPHGLHIFQQEIPDDSAGLRGQQVIQLPRRSAGVQGEHLHVEHEIVEFLLYLFTWFQTPVHILNATGASVASVVSVFGSMFDLERSRIPLP